MLVGSIHTVAQSRWLNHKMSQSGNAWHTANFIDTISVQRLRCFAYTSPSWRSASPQSVLCFKVGNNTNPRFLKVNIRCLNNLTSRLEFILRETSVISVSNNSSNCSSHTHQSLKGKILESKGLKQQRQRLTSSLVFLFSFSSPPLSFPSVSSSSLLDDSRISLMSIFQLSGTSLVCRKCSAPSNPGDR